MIIHTMEQGSPEWIAIKAGKISASVASELLVDGTKNSYGLGVGLINTAKKLVFERMNNQAMPSTGYKSQSMSRGSEYEAKMRRAYELYKFVKVTQVGFIESDCGTYGCSPDGLVGEDGGIEGKCFTLPNLHCDLLTGETNKEIDIVQIQFNLFTSKRKYWDFVSWYPEFKPKPLIVKTFYPDEEMHIKFEKKIQLLNQYIDEQIEKIKKSIDNG